MSVDRYDQFVTRQNDKVDRTREIERFRSRLRWWATSLALTTALFTILVVVGELT